MGLQQQTRGNDQSSFSANSNFEPDLAFSAIISGTNPIPHTKERIQMNVPFLLMSIVGILAVSTLITVITLLESVTGTCPRCHNILIIKAWNWATWCHHCIETVDRFHIRRYIQKQTGFRPSPSANLSNARIYI